MLTKQPVAPGIENPHGAGGTAVRKSIDRNAKQSSVLQNRGDVLEQDSLDWKIRHVTDSGFQFLVHGRWPQ